MERTDTGCAHTKVREGRLSAPLRMARGSELWWWEEKCSGKQGGFLVEDARGQESNPSHPCRCDQLAPALLAVQQQVNTAQLSSRRRWPHKTLYALRTGRRRGATFPGIPVFLPGALYYPLRRTLFSLVACTAPPASTHSTQPKLILTNLTPTQEKTCRAAARVVEPGASSAKPRWLVVHATPASPKETPS
jgi:hypothetical protein